MAVQLERAVAEVASAAAAAAPGTDEALHVAPLLHEWVLAKGLLIDLGSYSTILVSGPFPGKVGPERLVDRPGQGMSSIWIAFQLRRLILSPCCFVQQGG